MGISCKTCGKAKDDGNMSISGRWDATWNDEDRRQT